MIAASLNRPASSALKTIVNSDAMDTENKTFTKTLAQQFYWRKVKVYPNSL